MGEEMTVEVFLQWLSTSLMKFRTFPTLGRRSEFLAKYDSNYQSITIINSQNNSFKFSKEQIIAIFERWSEASPSNKYRTIYYERQVWDDVPSRYRPRDAPAIPAIIRDWEDEGGVPKVLQED